MGSAERKSRHARHLTGADRAGISGSAVPDNRRRRLGDVRPFRCRVQGGQQFGPTELAVFPYDAPAIGGCLMPVQDFRPSTYASLYLNADPSLDTVLSRVAEAGGTVVQAPP